MDTIVVTVTIEIPIKRIAELLSSAFEGGVGYWCRIIKYIKPETPRSVIDNERIYKHTDYPLTGGAVVCVETEIEDPHELVLDGAAIERGIKLMQEKYPRHFNDFLMENEDATTGDVFVQMCLLGELIYG